MPHIEGYLGTIARDLEIKVSSGKGTKILNFSIANKEGYGDSERTDFIPCTAFNKTAEIIAKYFKKGDSIIVSGKWQNSPYQKNEKGYDIPNWNYIVNSITFLPKPKATAANTFEVVNEFSPVSGNSDFGGFQPISPDAGDLPF